MIKPYSSFIISPVTSTVAMLLFIALSLIGTASASTRFLPAPPSIAAKSYILIDAETGETIIEQNAQQTLPPASLTKLMTSYITAHELQAGNISMEDSVLVSVKAWKKGGSKMYIREGDHVLLSDLIKGMVIQSGNDASIALAEHIAGSEDAFADLMNLHAAELGMDQSHFVNATGWPAEGHVTTAYDLSLLTRAMITRYPQHYKTYKEKSFEYAEIKQTNRNLLLWRDPSVDGVKTGHTEEAGYCLISSAERDGMRLISVVMGTNSTTARANQSLKLLNYGFRFYTTHTAYEPLTHIETAKVWKGNSNLIELGLTDAAILTLPKSQTDKLKVDITINEPVTAPIVAGDPLGQLTIHLDEETILEKPLVALQSIEQGGLLKRLWHALYLFFSSFF